MTELCLVQLTELSEILNFWKISSQMCLDFTPQPDKVQNRVAYRWNENFVSFSTVCVTFFYVEYCSHGAQICLSTFFLHTLYAQMKCLCSHETVILRTSKSTPHSTVSKLPFRVLSSPLKSHNLIKVSSEFKKGWFMLKRTKK